ncbi:AMP-binding protein [Patescibacteria group bacterium]|nr:AMP-binding protein [Patescibacteria group bacterium]
MNFFTSARRNREPAASFVVESTGSVFTYSHLDALSAQFVNTLVKLGVRKGDRVMVCAEKSLEALVVYIACLRAGFIFVPINPAYTKAELEYFITDARPAIIIVDPDKKKDIHSIPRALNMLIETLGVDGRTGSFLEKVREMPAKFNDVECDDDDLAAIVYTSGTTGRSKGAMISHNNLRSNAEALCQSWRFSNSDVLLHALPIFHVHGLFVATNVTLTAGSSMIFLPSFEVNEVISHLPRATVMMGVPTFYTLLLQDGRLTRDLVEHTRLFISGSAPLLVETHREWLERTGHEILERYGMTEAGMITSNPYNGERVPGAVGFPLPGIILRIVDQNTKELLANGQVGSIEIKGPNVFKGYWQMPEKTKDEFREDGFFVTGDLGFIDDKEYVHVIGRQKDLIITCGLNVYPKEIEENLNKILGITESAVIGVPHHEFGEGVVGVVVSKKHNLSEEQILVELKKNLAPYKIPLKIFLVDVLPRNIMGKVQKSALRASYSNLFTRKYE